MIITFLDDRNYTMDLMSSGARYERWFAVGRSIVKTGKIIIVILFL